MGIGHEQAGKRFTHSSSRGGGGVGHEQAGKDLLLLGGTSGHRRSKCRISTSNAELVKERRKRGRKEEGKRERGSSILPYTHYNSVQRFALALSCCTVLHVEVLSSHNRLS